MEIYTNPLFWLVITIAVVILYVYYRWDKNRKDKNIIIQTPIVKDNTETENDENENIAPYFEVDGVIPVRMPDNLLAKIYDTKISEKTALNILKEYGTLGRQWIRDNKKVYGINRFRDEIDKSIKLKPLFVPTEINSAPTQLHNDFKQPEIAIVISEMLKADEKGLGEQIIKYLPWLVALGFLAFLFMAS